MKLDVENAVKCHNWPAAHGLLSLIQFGDVCIHATFMPDTDTTEVQDVASC